MDIQSPLALPKMRTAASTGNTHDSGNDPMGTPKISQHAVSALNGGGGIKKSHSYHNGDSQQSPLSAFNDVTTLTLASEANKENVCGNSEAAVTPMNTLLPIELIREVLKDQIENLRDEMMSENFKFKAEMIKEFMSLKVYDFKSNQIQ
jgi:hypothetical protein